MAHPLLQTVLLRRPRVDDAEIQAQVGLLVVGGDEHGAAELARRADGGAGRVAAILHVRKVSPHALLHGGGVEIARDDDGHALRQVVVAVVAAHDLVGGVADDFLLADG